MREVVREKSKSEWETVMTEAFGRLFALSNKTAVGRFGPEKQNKQSC